MNIHSGSLVMNAGRLSVKLAENGCLLSLGDTEQGGNDLHPDQPSYLVTARFLGDPGRVVPTKCLFAPQSPLSCDITCVFETGPSLVVRATECDGYLRLQAIGTSHPNNLQCLFWGPIATTLEGPIGEYLGLLRSDTFTLGLLSLDSSTDGGGDSHFLSGHWLPRAMGGSYLELQAENHSQNSPRKVFGTTVAGKAVPGLTVLKSCVALFGCRESEALDLVERIEQQEGLPHPTIDGEWTKRSRFVRGSSWWTDYTEENIDRCLDLAVETGFKWLCRFRTFGNWGHFEPDPALYPNGFGGFRACSDKAEARGIHALFYTLSTFLKEISVPEPYISPVPDPRLQTVWPETVLSDSLAETDVTLCLAGNDELLDMLNEKQMEVSDKVVRIDDELIGYQQVSLQGNRILLENCIRGFYRTIPAKHALGAGVARMVFTYWNNFFPGTEEMNAEVGRRVGALARQGHFRQVTLDGHEGCLFTGHGAFSKHVFLDAIYQETKDLGFLYTSSNLGNWIWHTLSYISWGEYDCHKGFRGGMLDYRVWRMIQLRNNLMPRRLGQHYPDRHTTVEDIEWLMALASGWDAGVELHVQIDDFNQNPHRAEIVRKIRLWEEARLNQIFTDEQKRNFRQTDRLHTLDQAPDGTGKVTFLRRWQYAPLEMRPASSVVLSGVGKHKGRVGPCSISYDWTHDPGIYQSAWLSDDMIHESGGTSSTWELLPPEFDKLGRDGQQAQKLQFVLRLPETATEPICNPRVTVNSDPEIEVRIPAVLQPGQYLSTPHDIPMAFVYDSQHNVIAEIPIRDLPNLPEGKITLTLTADGMARKKMAPILNIRTHKHIPIPA
jgi:hypothetical protein